MAGIRERLRDWMGPSKRELAAEIAHLQEMQQKFPGRGKQVAAGTKMGWGEFQYDPNSVLHGAAKYGIYDKMEADPHVKGVLLDKALPLLTAEWEIKPASDKAKDVEVAEFCAANLLHKPSDRFGRDYWIETPWEAQRLPEILTMLNNGFALFVSSWKRVGTRVVYDRLQWIEPSTIDGSQPWVIDDKDHIVAVNRKLTTPQQQFIFDERIEADRLKLYVWDIKGARYEGQSFLRAMYGAWFRKDYLQHLAIIFAQKVGAPAPVGHYPFGWDGKHVTRFQQFVKAMRGKAPAEAFGVFPKDADGNSADVKYAGAEVGDVDRMRGLIRGENEEIHQGGRDSSAMLGETSTGSRALGDSKGKREVKLTQAIGVMLATWENHGVANLKGTIEDLVGRNYTVSANPELVCSKIDPYENFTETLDAWKAGIIPKTPESRRQITEGTLGLNLPDDAYEIEEPPPMIPGQPPPRSVPGEEPEDEEDDDEKPEDAALSAADTFAKRIAGLLEPSQQGAPPKGRRFPDEAGGAATRLAEDRPCDTSGGAGRVA